MNRSATREAAFKLVYSLEVQKNESIEEQTELFLENENINEEKTVEYIKNIVTGIKDKSEIITQNIATNLKSGWSIERISKVDLVLLKIAIYEILYTETPYKVAINEVIELNKKIHELQKKIKKLEDEVINFYN